jgi:hypothetical protein
MRRLTRLALAASTFAIGAFAAQACSSSDDGTALGGDAGGADASSSTDTGSPSSDGGTADAAPDSGSTIDAPIDSPPTCNQTDGGGTPTLIASGQKQPFGVAVDGTSIYWGNQGDGTIVKCPLAGCGGTPPQVIASGQSYPEAVHVQGNYVYWINFFGSLQRCPITGCGDAGVESYPATAGAGFAVDSNNVYWTEFNAGTLLSCPLGGCTKGAVLYQGVKGLTYGVALDATTIYLMNALSGEVLAVPMTGVPDGGSARLIATSSDPSYIAVGAGQVYWDSLAAGSSVQALPVSATADAGIAPTIVATNMPHAAGMTFDSVCGTLYWTANGLSTADGGRAGGGVFRCPAAGCGDASAQRFGVDNEVWFAAVDDGYVYWADEIGGNVWRVAK